MRALAMWLMLLSAPAAAQTFDLTVPDPIARELTEVRLSHHVERRESGIVLLGAGLGSVIGGASVAGAVHDDPFWLVFGAGTAAWGAVNAALAFVMLDIGDGGSAHIRRSTLDLRGEDLARERERAMRAQTSTGVFYLFNLMLDVFYIGSAALLYVLASELTAPDDAYLRGYSAAQIAQGIFLFGFDLVGWLSSEARAERIARIARPR